MCISVCMIKMVFNNGIVFKYIIIDVSNFECIFLQTQISNIFKFKIY